MSEQLVKRLRELSNAVTRADWNEFSMRIPAEKDRDADFVLLRAANKIAALEADAARMDWIQKNLLCAEKHLAALNHTEGKKKIDDAVDKAWGRFCAAMPDDQSPYPGMAKAFEVHYGVSWTDRDWRNEQSTWAAAWRMAWDRRATVLDAEQDAARLDFLDSIGAAYGFEDTHEGNRWMIDGPFNSLRAAIDAAIDNAQNCHEHHTE